MTHEEEIRDLLDHPQKLLQKKPFTRGAEFEPDGMDDVPIYLNNEVQARLPRYKRIVVPQEQFLQELDPNCHSVLFDDSIPSICVKTKKDGFVEIDYEKMAVSFQKKIRNKKYLHMSRNETQFTLIDKDPTEQVANNFITIKQEWDLRNMDGWRNKFILTQMSVGDGGLLFYYNHNDEVKCRLISFMDGYVICTHRDHNGEVLLETIYYSDNGVEYIDSYDETYRYRYSNDLGTLTDEDIVVDGWRWHKPVKHGFSEIPLVSHRGDVAWEDAQSIITSYEILYNIFNAIQKRLGWGLLYIKGKFKQNAKKIAGSVILNDDSLDSNGDAKFLTPPTPDNTIKTLELMEETIQKCAGCTFILPKDIKVSGDISGVAVEMTQGLDIETAQSGAIEWQNVIDKMVRLFKEGLANEYVAKKKNEKASTEFAKIRINAYIKIWRPKSDIEYNNMLSSSVTAGILSQETGVECHTESKPDELKRIQREAERKFDTELEQTKRKKELDQEFSNNDDDNNNNNNK